MSHCLLRPSVLLRYVKCKNSAILIILCILGLNVLDGYDVPTLLFLLESLCNLIQMVNLHAINILCPWLLVPKLSTLFIFFVAFSLPFNKTPLMSSIFKIPYFKFCKLSYLHNISTPTACKSSEDESAVFCLFSTTSFRLALA